MPGAYGKLKRERWRHDGWLKLPADAQWLYMYLLTQPSTDTCGLFPIQISKWAKGAADMTIDRVKAAASTLLDSGWVAMDHDTEEGIIVNYIRDDEAGENIFKGAINRAIQVQSSVLRRRLLEEILKLDREFKERAQSLIDKLAESLDADTSTDPHGTAPSPPPSSTATTQAFEHPSRTVVRPSECRSDTVTSNECVRCRQAPAIGEDAIDGENPMWCAYCNTEAA